jgi:hypothetical protein
MVIEIVIAISIILELGSVSYPLSLGHDARFL